MPSRPRNRSISHQQQQWFRIVSATAWRCVILPSEALPLDLYCCVELISKWGRGRPNHPRRTFKHTYVHIAGHNLPLLYLCGWWWWGTIRRALRYRDNQQPNLIVIPFLLLTGWVPGRWCYRAGWLSLATITLLSLVQGVIVFWMDPSCVPLCRRFVALNGSILASAFRFISNSEITIAISCFCYPPPPSYHCGGGQVGGLEAIASWRARHSQTSRF